MALYVSIGEVITAVCIFLLVCYTRPMRILACLGDNSVMLGVSAEIAPSTHAHRSRDVGRAFYGIF
jgi:hypothetical protein